MDTVSFRNPSKEYRPIPFWSLNDKLEPAWLQKQVKSFGEAGMGGYFMHARPGIRTPFLQEEWFTAIAAAVSSAKEHGMQAWLYDECCYPSGFAAGMVYNQRPDLAQKWLGCRVVPQDGAANIDKRVIAELGCFAVNERGYRKVTAAKDATDDETVLQFVMGQVAEWSWLNGTPYVDLLHEDSGAEFLRVAYEPYVERLAPFFGNLIPGIFTDEPNFNPSAPGPSLPWTPSLVLAFQNRYGDNLLDLLPELFVELGSYTSTRYRFWRLVTERFISAWMQPVYEWCSRHNLQFTGHLWEHVLAPTFSGSLMAPLEYMHIPGLDLLGQNAYKGRLPQAAGFPAQMGNVHMVKVVTSVAHQLGRERVLSETYGGCGWALPFEGQKDYAEWEYVLGVNLLNQHLSHYSLRGYRKHDYPISFQDHQPWWQWYRLMGDYFGRLSYALSQGTYQAELLVLHPMASIWSTWRPAMPATVPGSGDTLSQQLRQTETMLDHLTKTLSAANWGYDFGDDLIMERHAAVVQGSDGKPRLQVGQMQYQAVILPGCQNLTAATHQLLCQFAANGGRIYSMPPFPQQIDGADAHLPNITGTEAASIADLLCLLAADEKAERLNRQVVVGASSLTAPVYHLIRQTTDGNVCFLVNVSNEAHCGAKVWLQGSGQVERWDLQTGEREILPSTPCNGGVEVELDFSATESHLLFQRTQLNLSTSAVENPSVSVKEQVQVAQATAAGRHLPTTIKRAKSLANAWQFQRLDPNVLLLDRCSYKIGDEPWSPTVFTQEAVYRLRQRYQLMTLPFREVQPWVKHPSGPPEFPDIIKLKYTVQSHLAEWGPLYLVVEDAPAFAITVNGHAVTTAPSEVDAYWLDPAFRRIPVHPVWREGENVVELTFRFHEDLPVDPAFLLGDFAVRCLDADNTSLEPENAILNSGTWVNQGYPFYVGRAVYTQTVELTETDLAAEVWLECSDLPNMAQLRCNGHEVGLLAWRPYRANLTPWLKPGANTLVFEVANSLHNALGPLHTPSLPGIIGPGQYTYHPSWVTHYNVVHDGLATTIKLLYT